MLKTTPVILSFLLGTAPAEDTPAPVNAHDGMLKFVEYQKILKSCIMKSNTKAIYSYTGFNNGPGTGHRHSDARFDGGRAKEETEK